MAKFLNRICASLHIRHSYIIFLPTGIIELMSREHCVKMNWNLDDGHDAWSIFIWERQCKKAVIRAILWVPLYVNR